VMEDRFDQLAKSVAGSISRREALRSLGGGLAALLLSTAGLAPAWAARGGNGKGGSSSGGDCTAWCKARFAPGAAQVQCKRVCEECGGNTSRLCTAGPNQGVLCCEEGEGCYGTALGVPVCANLSSDEQNCGTIGNQCPVDWTCCSGQCFDTSSDPDNCGGCDSLCPAVESDETFYHRCCGGACVDTESDPQHCGACERACAPGFACEGLKCTCATDDDCPSGDICTSSGHCN
jgi:hypothetical protein